VGIACAESRDPLTDPSSPYLLISDPDVLWRVQQIEAIAGVDARFEVKVEKPPGEQAAIVRVICVFKLPTGKS